MTKNPVPIGHIGDYEIKQLKIFKVVADCGGFSAAETELNVSRSTISIHISNLESRLNLILCRRGRSGFALTEEGTVVYEATVKLLGELDDFRNTINHLDIQPSGSLTVLFSDNISLDTRAKMPEVIRKFAKIAKEVYLTAEVARMTEIERKVLQEEADIGFIPFHRELDGLEYEHIYTDICYLYASKDNPLAKLDKNELSDEVINGFPVAYAGIKTQERLNSHLAKMNLKATAYNYESRMALVLSSRFIGYLPENYAKPYVDSGQLVPIAPKERYYYLEIMAITKKTNSINKVRSLFVKTMRDFYRELHE
ncbi:LysR family transcriptional regulator [Vibrio panuliri]|uniref:LysR family transcriptional regulator n=1 Tax=Vibrio panuliri TaxID=1381081 RepID=A0A1Q9HJU7_9VIBR|nr:LysR family transcriptional regulator [Vibrio panuliri]KAB1453867.1 LysR family transcriptional regulator [Vibrio panuliri]OLQ87880.1 LysR family transcriptional regulator [Vibrio panuliri]OLQ90583.1 LysR family transcriptional regulator [Vibrio panuliri]